VRPASPSPGAARSLPSVNSVLTTVFLAAMVRVNNRSLSIA
jgi:hypothetical protein